jgi:hypothetical protein
MRRAASSGLQEVQEAGHQNFWTYSIEGMANLEAAMRYTHRPLKQAVLSPSALSLLYPEDGIPGYSADHRRAREAQPSRHGRLRVLALRRRYLDDT